MVLILACIGGTARAQVVEYTDETAFLNALTSQGHIAVQESFEDDLAWGAVRSTIAGGQHTAPSVTNLGITWSSSSSNNEITTGPGPARTGDWGFFSLPHGDYANGITDGWHGMADQPLVAIGGWVDGTYGGRINLILDGDELNPADFGGANGLGGAYQFFGVIDPNGFSVFDFRETEGTIGDQKYIFGDDFTFAYGGTIQDCNQNGLADALDIAGGTSTDCNNNAMPDECEIDINSTAPGGPFFCTQNCLPDCNNNGMLDECEVVMPEVYASGQLSPVGNGSPQSFTVVSPPVTLADAILDFTAYANLGGAPDHISVDINGASVGTVFGPDGSDCPEVQPDAARLVIPKATFNDAVNGGDAVLNMVASAEVDPEGCDLPTFITVDVTLFVSSASDINGNGTPDSCEPVPGDFNGDLDVDKGDLDAFEECASGPGVPMAAGCEDKDFDNDGDGDQSDFAVIQKCISGENVFGDPNCAN
jgi:hypothetical protein